MTRFIPDDECNVCGSVLIPREAASGNVPKNADYVCLKCGRPYRWTGNPPRLTALSVVETRADDDDDL